MLYYYFDSNLVYFNFEKKFIIETNVLNNIFMEVLFLYGDNKLFCLIVFFSQKHLP